MNQQTSLPFFEFTKQVTSSKEKRKSYLLEYIKSEEDINLLLKITFDITPKDFEYLVKYLIYKDGFEDFKVSKQKDYFDLHGEDLVGTKNNIQYSYQCKQWKNQYISLKKLGEYYATIFHTKRLHPEMHFWYITTSYIKDQRAEEFLKYNNIEWMDHRELVKWCKKYNLHQESEWGMAIEWIEKIRCSEEGGIIPLSYSELTSKRLMEFVAHLPLSYHNGNISLSVNYYNFAQRTSFFQYWHLH